MTIRRVMPNVVTEDIEESRSFYGDFLGMDVRMDEPGFLMLASPSNPTIPHGQSRSTSPGGSTAPQSFTNFSRSYWSTEAWRPTTTPPAPGPCRKSSLEQ
ncbi:hypothetical protein [Streptomyces sp. NPDC046631]|uniref:hypothetical protein n=1 Tax=unclassified Streptomyces TaxID=2593676 RepID=UPI00340477C9